MERKECRSTLFSVHLINLHLIWHFNRELMWRVKRDGFGLINTKARRDKWVERRRATERSSFRHYKAQNGDHSRVELIESRERGTEWADKWANEWTAPLSRLWRRRFCHLSPLPAFCHFNAAIQWNEIDFLRIHKSPFHTSRTKWVSHIGNDRNIRIFEYYEAHWEPL